jgi:hypothetical protein
MAFLSNIPSLQVHVGLQYLEHHHPNDEKHTRFRAYFKTIWLHKYPTELWSYQGIGNELVSRTNNALERYKAAGGEIYSFASQHSLSPTTQRGVLILPSTFGANQKRL